MTDLKVAAAFVLGASLFLLSAIGSGRGYRTASDLTLEAITAGGAARKPSAAAPRGSGQAKPQPGTTTVTRRKAGSPPSGGASTPAAPSSPSAPGSRTRASTPSPVEIERDVTYGSTEEYTDDDKEYKDEDRDDE